MSTDILLAILKTSSALISGLLGLTALFSNFRIAGGPLNLTGKLVLFGILVSAAVAATISVLESLSSFESNRQQMARNEALLYEISRAVQPISVQWGLSLMSTRLFCGTCKKENSRY